MTDETEYDYADIDYNRVGMLLMIVSECAKHGASFSSISGEAVLELSAINAEVLAFVAERTKAEAAAKAEVDAEAKANAVAEAERSAPKAIPAKDLEPAVTEPTTPVVRRT